MVSYYNYCLLNIIHILVFIHKRIILQRLDSVSVFKGKLFSRGQWLELVANAGNQHRHIVGCINQAETEQSAGVKTKSKLN
jgi:hypothetical protein